MQLLQREKSSVSDDWLVGVAQKMKERQFAHALSVLLPVLQSKMVTPRVLLFAITCYWELGDTDTVFALSKVATEMFPRDTALWNQRGVYAMYGHKTDLARACFETALKQSPRDLQALISWNVLDVFQRSSSQDKKLRAHLKSKNLLRRERAATHSAIARIEAKAGNYARAFHHYAKSNEATGGAYYPDEMEALVAAQRQIFQPSDVSASGHAAPLLLIGGMPRSGTTLVESIFSRHPNVTCVGESAALQSALLQARRMVADDGVANWDWYQRVSADQIEVLREAVAMNMGLTRGKTVVSKMPLDCLNFGLAHLLFPQARFVHMIRDPMACGWSNFSTNFQTGNAFSTRLDWIGHLTRVTHESALDYRDKLGRAFRFQSYRSLVQDPEDQIRKLLDHSGLDWHEDCLRPENSTHVQRTASMLQVRAPINSHGLDKWRTYASHLEPLEKALGGRAQIDEWDQFERALD